MKNLTIVGALVVFLCGHAHADTTSSANIAIGYAEANKNKGLEIDLTLSTVINDKVILNLTPIGGIFYQKKDDNYRKETFFNDQEVCRDTRNGQFAEKDNCDKKGFDYAASADINLKLNDYVTVGAGSRFGKKINPYGTIVVSSKKDSFNNSFGLRGKFGKDYYSLDFVINFK